ncbi:membrane-bound PQQ-dependent dehydrogenase, glucose/quinate/shikimate family [Pseudomonas typographi]|uniref:membrane-bound PQQ-dependent dehydrogenase, glucose/quinate/shikimate family n=1 Tax=Pseudomonas typographi TaxID=2715964 RepID=UPI001683A2EF|nr:membrane-bound PQQ-dependent dehydrogenase, glucose/quinate/shikimate family [Pseudomonas typographi]MBD1551593.1 membrane-bound PQQ-dependent dehydrogenase, glucose/quinate/shikimate family [Pseudomonas typographi]
MGTVVNQRRPVFISGVLLLLGMFLMGGGGYLAALGGSWYYLLIGIGFGATGVLLWRQQAAALWLYTGLLLATLAWAWYEVGADFWSLEPRLLMPWVLGLWLLLPMTWRRLASVPKAAPRALAASVAVVFVAAVAAAAQPYGVVGETDLASIARGQGDDSVADGDWQYYGRTAHGERYSPLKQITADNISGLKLAWSTRTGDTQQAGEDVVAGPDQGHEFNLEVTPIKVGDTLYMCTPHSWVMAMDARTGKIKWKYDPKPNEANLAANVYLACRGVSYYEAPPEAKTSCPRRIISPVADARIIAVNADTGKPCDDFGDHGSVWLTDHMGNVPLGFHFVTSPPLVVKDRVVLGGWVFDNQANFEPSGAIRAYDALTGKMAWGWDAGHSPENWVPQGDETFTRDTPNAWGVFTADPKLGLLYIPTGNSPPDNWGGSRRPFDDATSSATIALDIETGERRWTFQTVHHDLWDMDIPSGPSLVDLPDASGQQVPAMVQSTKRGEFFVLDRRTGQPVPGYPVEERKVPTAGVAPGDWVSPTQPYAAGLPSLTPPDLKESDMWGATMLDQLSCRIEYRQAAYQGQFTPPQVGQETIVYPAFYGIVDWQGATIDPVHKLLVANASYLPFRIRMEKRESVEAAGVLPPWDGKGNKPAAKGDALSISPNYGTPYVAYTSPWLNALQVPCKGPVWGTLTAIDLVTKRIVWQHPVGTTRDTGPFRTHNNLPLPTGMYNIGGNIITGSGLVFMGATGDDYLRAFTLKDGKEVWRTRLPAGGQATPMSYEVGGRQYVLIAAGGHGGLGTRSGDYIMAYALPD